MSLEIFNTMHQSSTLVQTQESGRGFATIKNVSCTEIHFRRMRLAVMWSIILQLILLFFFIMVISIEPLSPFLWPNNFAQVFMSFTVWIKLLLLVVIIYIQGEVCKKDYVTGPIYYSTRFQKIKLIFSLRNVLLLGLHMVIGFTIFWIYSSISAQSYQSLTVECKASDLKHVNYCLVEDKFFLLLGGFWLGIYYFANDYMFGSRNLSFPLIQQYKFYRVKAALKQNLKQCVKSSVLPTITFIILYYFYGGFVRATFMEVISCSLDTVPIDSIQGLMKVRLIFSLWLFSSIFIVSLQMMELLFNVYLTEHCIFPVTTTILPPGNYISLIESLKTTNIPIIHHLGYLDLFILATMCQIRREEIFTLSHPGGHPHSWNGVFKECNALIKTFTSNLNQALEQAINLSQKTVLPVPKAEVTNIHFHSHNIRKLESSLINKDIPNYPQSGVEIAFNNLQNWFNLKLDQIYQKPYIAYLFLESPDSRINYLLCQCQPVIWAVQSLAFLTAASLCEDRFGIVQRDLSDVIFTIVSLKQALDKLFKQNLIVKKSFSCDPLDVQMKHLLRTSVKRSLYKIAVIFGPYVKELKLPADIELQMNNFIVFKEVF